MTQPTLLELAKKGDENALNSVMNYLLKDKGIAAQATQKDDCLLVLFKSERLPDQKASVALVHQLMVKLEIQSIKSVKVYGKQVGQSSPGWTESLDLIYPVKELKQQTKFSESLSEENQKARNASASGEPTPHLNKAIMNHWPKWFPYPSSWFRALILIPLITSIVWGSFIFAGLWSYLLLAITNSREVLFLAGGLMLILPTLSLAYVHYFFSLLRGKQALSTSWLRWLPSRKCLWLGFYDTVVLFLCTIITFIILDLLIPRVQFCNSYETADQIATCREFIKTDLAKYAIQYHLNEIAVIIWVILPAYLYQDEYLIRQRLFPHQNVALSHKDRVEVEDTHVKGNSQPGERELNQTKKGIVKPNKTISLSQQNQRKSQKLARKLLIFFLIPCVALGIYVSSKWSEFKDSIPRPVASQTSIPVSSQTPMVIPSPVPSVSSEPPQPSQTDPFQKAVNKGMNAATLTQSAKSKDEWNLVASEWQEAIALMKAVPLSHAQHTTAQQKAIEYQRNLDYAQKNATKGQ
jgi:uncharacterized protein (DUF924 family)